MKSPADIVTSIARETKEKLKLVRDLQTRFDLRLFSLKMLKLQRQLRTESAKRRTVALEQARQWRLRARRPLKDAEVEVRYSTHDGDVYAKLDNGQVLRASPRVRGERRHHSALISNILEQSK